MDDNTRKVLVKLLNIIKFMKMRYVILPLL